MKNKANIAIFVPHSGCPNQCSFCNQHSISGSARVPTPEEVKKTTEKVNGEIKITNVKGQDIELPPKNGKVELEEFDVPNITCNCSGPDEVCPVCEEEKIGSY